MTVRTTNQAPAPRYAPGSVLNIVPYHSTMIVRTDEGPETFNVVGWATVISHYDEAGDAHTCIEHVVRVRGDFYTTTDLRQKYGDDSIVNVH
ncbi:hypothetical protein [Streptomyces sp. NPDC006477]|uniref:hypothetical protein n=1 Tax=Streptomyces sp. NPDC006477 TaxID=3364747 RepID=UPI003673CCC1